MGKGRGREALYPPKTLEAIRFILRLKKEKQIRRLSAIRVWLWLRGFWVDQKKMIDDLRDQVKEMKKFQVNSLDDVPMMVEQARKKAFSRPILNARFTDTEKNDKLLTLIIQLLSGLPVDFDPDLFKEDRELAQYLEATLGLDRAREDALSSMAPWLGGIPGDYIPWLANAKILSIDNIYASLGYIPEERLNQTRLNFVVLLRIVLTLRVLSEVFTKRFGFSALKNAISWSAKNIDYLLILLVYYQSRGMDVSNVVSRLNGISIFQFSDDFDRAKRAQLYRNLRAQVHIKKTRSR